VAAAQRVIQGMVDKLHTAAGSPALAAVAVAALLGVVVKEVALAAEV
jgi:hypothetical protein